LGLSLVATGLVGITYGLAECGSAGSLTAPQVLIPRILGLALVAAFVLRALRIPNPLLDVRLYANKAFASASVTMFALGAALFGAMVLMPLYFQTVRGEDAVATGLLIAPQGIGAAFAMGLSSRYVERYGGGLTSLVGATITLIATVPFVLIGAETSYWLIGAAMIVRGFGIGMSMMPAMTAAFAVLRPDQINTATPQLNVLQRVGGSIGTAILAVSLQNGISSLAEPTPAGIASAFADTYWWVMGITVVALLPTIVLTVVERRAKAEHGTHAVPADAIVEAAA
jgi:MFS family permease